MSKSVIKAKYRKKSITFRIIIVACIAAMVTCGIILAKTLLEYRHVDVVNMQTQTEITDELEELPEDKKEEMKELAEESKNKGSGSGESPAFYYDHEKALAKNQYSVGYVWIPSTDTRLPMVQYYDNNYFLYRAYDFSYSRGGTIFVDANLEKGLNSTHTIIYGHNMLNKTMFSKNNYYKSESFYWADAGNKYFYIYTPKMLRKYHIYAAFSSNARDNDVYEIDMPVDVEHGSGGQTSLQDYVYKMRNNYSWYTTDANVENVSQVASLVCCMSGNLNKRFVIQGTLIEETPFRKDYNPETDYMLKSNIKHYEDLKERYEVLHDKVEVLSKIVEEAQFETDVTKKEISKEDSNFTKKDNNKITVQMIEEIQKEYSNVKNEYNQIDEKKLQVIENFFKERNLDDILEQ